MTRPAWSRNCRRVAGAIGIEGPVWAATPLPADIKAGDYAIFAGVLPEDKFRLVKALRNEGHIVGMCGDGANDALPYGRRKWESQCPRQPTSPNLRQASC